MPDRGNQQGKKYQQGHSGGDEQHSRGKHHNGGENHHHRDHLFQTPDFGLQGAHFAA